MNFCLCSIPVTYHTVPATCDEFWGVNWVPIYANADPVVGLEYSQVVSAFPIPEINSTFCISTCQKLAIRRKSSLYRIPRTLMSSKFLLSIKPKSPSLRIINCYLIICWLHRTILLRRMHWCWSNSMHIWLRNMGQNSRDSELPNENLFVVSRAYEFSIVIYKGNRIDCTKMFCVLLNFFTDSEIVLGDFFVLSAY